MNIKLLILLLYRTNSGIYSERERVVISICINICRQKGNCTMAADYRKMTCATILCLFLPFSLFSLYIAKKQYQYTSSSVLLLLLLLLLLTRVFARKALPTILQISTMYYYNIIIIILTKLFISGYTRYICIPLYFQSIQIKKNFVFSLNKNSQKFNFLFKII